MAKRNAIVHEAIDYLIAQAREHPAHEQTLLSHVTRYSQRHRATLTYEQKRAYCPACLKIQRGERIRTEGSTIKITCPCGHFRMLDASRPNR